MEEVRTFKKVDRSYHSTRDGYRLATFEEAEKGLVMIKQQGLLNKWDRVRLLDGWITGPGYEYQMGKNFRSCMGYMLLIQTIASRQIIPGSVYNEVKLIDERKQVALFLCVDDWNLELVYWLLNSWMGSETMDMKDVIEGNIPFSEVEKFKEMNEMLCYLARKFGDQGPFDSEKAAKSRYSGQRSAKIVLGDRFRIVEENQIIEEKIGICIDYLDDSFPRFLEPKWLEKVASEAGEAWKAVADVFWNFLYDNYADFVVELFSNFSCLEPIYRENSNRDINTMSTSDKNFICAISILLYLSYFRCTIVHESMTHGYRTRCSESIICQAANEAGDDNFDRFKELLRNNALWRGCNDTGNYNLLNKLLACAAKGTDPWNLEQNPKADILMIKRLLECGAQPTTWVKISEHKKKRALDYVVKWQNEDLGRECAKCLLDRFDGQEMEKFVNDADENGRTALHRASSAGNSRICELLLVYGAALDAQDKNYMTALHLAVKRRQPEVINVFLEDLLISRCVDLKDKDGDSPLDALLSSRDTVTVIGIESVAKLFSKSKQPEVYFKDHGEIGNSLLSELLIKGYIQTVIQLSKTVAKLPDALHLAAMCAENRKALHMVHIILAEAQGKQKMVANRNIRGRTVLHEAALAGNELLCLYLLNINSKIITVKDIDGRNALYEAVKGKQCEIDVLTVLFEAFPDSVNVLDDSIDCNGQTPLHVAASLGKTEVVEFLLGKAPTPPKYVKKSDFFGKTALHNAAKYGDLRMVRVLLNNGAQPLGERDCDSRTALHYVVQSKTGEEATQLADLLLEGCKTDEEKLLFLWASATGLGTADRNLSEDDRLHQFLRDKKNEISKTLGTSNLLKVAASVGDIEMTKELISRGYQVGDIYDAGWMDKLESSRQKNVEMVSRQLVKIAEQGNDQPTISDNLGRIDYAHGLAALFLNPYIKPPIAVGISGPWGMGKSSLMVQTESILLKTAAQMALLPSSKLPSSALELPDMKTFKLSNKGKKKYEEIKRYLDYKLSRNGEKINGEIHKPMNYEHKGNRSLFSTMMDKIPSWLKKKKTEDTLEEAGQANGDSLSYFLRDYRVEYRKIFKLLAAMDSSDMFTTCANEDSKDQKSRSKTIWDMFTTRSSECKEHQSSRSKTVRDMIMFSTKGRENREHQNADSKTIRDRFSRNVQQSKVDFSQEENVPVVLTVQYNAWRYRGETEALAGMAVEITKELERIMTQAQWLSTCWRNTWKKRKYNIWIEIIYPCFLAVALASIITWIVWVVLDRYQSKDWAKAKFACLPAAVIIIGWTLTKSVMGNLKPVSTQLMNYISFPDHTDNLGYQERVISDIRFLKGEIGKKPCMVFSFFSWVLSTVAAQWLFITEWWVTSLLYYPKFLGKTVKIPNIPPASGTNLRIIVFIDDLDRCQESVILQVLAAINLVLAVCGINVVVGIDRELIKRAVTKKYGDMKTNRSFKDNEELADKYLQKIIQLPVDLPDPSEEQSQMFLKGQLGVFQTSSKDCESEINANTYMTRTSSQRTSMPDTSTSREPMLGDVTRRGTASEIIPDPHIAVVDVEPSTEIEMEAPRDKAAPNLSGETRREDPPEGDLRVVHKGNINSWPWIPIREMLFVRYSQGEQDAFCCFQKMATNSRKLPREWKRLITYHRLVWNILYITREAKDLAGWQVQLITWIFVCWEWQDNMNFVIENWSSIRVLKNSGSEGPSLQMVVNHFIELESKKLEEDERKGSIPKDGVSSHKNLETESKNSEIKESEDVPTDDSMRENTAATPFEGKMKLKREEKDEDADVVRETLDNAVKEELVDKTLRKELDDLKQEMKDLKYLVMKQYDRKNEDDEQNRMKLLNGVKEEVKDLKDQIMKQDKRKNEKWVKEKRMKLQSWKRLRSVLSIYNVSMDSILAFQRFRFYCIARHLSWPLPEQENEQP